MILWSITYFLLCIWSYCDRLVLLFAQHATEAVPESFSTFDIISSTLGDPCNTVERVMLSEFCSLYLTVNLGVLRNKISSKFLKY